MSGIVHRENADGIARSDNPDKIGVVMKTTALTTYLYAPSADLWDWQLSANCRSMGTDLFFSPEGETREARRYRENFATRICQTCPVLEQCRTHAQTVREPFGIWGGTTESERRCGSDARPGSVAADAATGGRTTRPAARRLTVSGSHPGPGRRPRQASSPSTVR
ncbi:WhiB family transcriptional regulator [Rhodococcus sp. JS3073]|uniref:WhiB family transcriptional regulator n=1 Tax=Rhodococcus sp. JS3073 TaxID=3002901 RepID=UPI002E1AC372